MLKRGSMGEEVKKLQTMLKDFGWYAGDIDGVFEDKTEIAVKRFQKQTGVGESGIIDQDTWIMLNNAYSPASSQNGYDANANGFLTYMVKPNDTLSDLAQKFDTTAHCIMIENKLTSTILEDGQKLTIPVGKTVCALGDVYMNQYSVVYGDSLWKIANRFGIAVEEIKKLNGLQKDSLSIGQILKISQ